MNALHAFYIADHQQNSAKGEYSLETTVANSD